MKGAIVAVLVLVAWKESVARPKHNLQEEPVIGMNRGDSSGIRATLARALKQMNDEELLNTLGASIDLRILLCFGEKSESLPLPTRRGKQHSTFAPTPTTGRNRPAGTTKVSTESAVFNPTNKPVINPTSRSSNDAPRKERNKFSIKYIIESDEPDDPSESTNDSSSTEHQDNLGMDAVARPHPQPEVPASAPVSPAAEKSEQFEAVIDWDNELDRLVHDADSPRQPEAEMRELANEEKEPTNDAENEFSYDDSDSEHEKSELVDLDEGQLNSDAGEFESIMTIGAQATDDEKEAETEVNNWVGIELFKKPKVKNKNHA